MPRIANIAARIAVTGPLALAFAAGACGGASPPLLDDAAYFHVGVDPHVVMSEVASALEAVGRRQTARVARERFVAASFAGVDGRSSVRLATARGLALALDASAEDGVLVALGAASGADLDGDQAPDVVIERRESHRTCLALVGVDHEGRMRPVATDPTGLDPRACIEGLVDLDHDGRVEALVPLRDEDAFAPAEITLPLTRDARGAFARGAWPEGFARDEIGRREAALEVAVDGRDELGLLRLAIELAWIARERGASPEDVLATLDAALGRLPLGVDASERAARARQAFAAPAPAAAARAEGASSESASASE
ncbi:MAG: hypothetical protein OHK0013_49660 [Sandaracinaceae bacterium]